MSHADESEPGCCSRHETPLATLNPAGTGNYVNPMIGRIFSGNPMPQLDALDQLYYPSVPVSRSAQFTSNGYRAHARQGLFTQMHVAAIAQALCDYRREHRITGPCFFAKDTHYFSQLAYLTALEVFTANSVSIFVHPQHRFTPYPALSLAVVTYNRRRACVPADGLLFSPCCNPPDCGGVRYVTPTGGCCAPSEAHVIENKMRYYLLNPQKIKRLDYQDMLLSPLLVPYDYAGSYADVFDRAINLKAIASKKIKITCDVQCGAAGEFCERVGKTYDLDLRVLNDSYDPTFQTIKAASEPEKLKKIAQESDMTILYDADADLQYFLLPSGFITSRMFERIVLDYLLSERTKWPKVLNAAVFLVDDPLLPSILKYHGVEFTPIDVPVVTNLDFDGNVWTCDRDALLCSFLAAEIMAVSGMTLEAYYQDLLERYRV